MLFPTVRPQFRAGLSLSGEGDMGELDLLFMLEDKLQWSNGLQKKTSVNNPCHSKD